MGRHRPRGAGRTKQQSHFGLHLTLDGYWCSVRRLGDLSLITRALEELPQRMGMKRLIPPYVVRASDNRKNDPGGYSGFVIVQESHISIHTFPLRRFVSIDVYSCRNFKTAPVVSYFRRMFDMRKIEKNVIVRGKEYSRTDL